MYLRTNEKLKKSGIYTWDLPPVTTCPGRGTDKHSPCSKCYAQKGFYRVFADACAGLRQKNYGLSMTDRFVEAIVAEIQSRKSIKIVRIHSTGDFYSQEYLEKWFRVARLCPGVRFYCYTKSLHLNWSMMPKNFGRVQSLGGKYDNLVDWSGQVACVFPSKDALLASGYQDGSENDLVACLGFSRVGLVQH